MNVEIPELLVGAFTALLEPAGEGAGGEFAAGRIGVVGLLALMGAQESETGAAVRIAENRALGALLRRARDEGWPGARPDTLEALCGLHEDDFTLTALDARNAALKEALIALHVAAEAMPGPEGLVRERAILELLKTAARARQMLMPQQTPPP